MSSENNIITAPGEALPPGIRMTGEGVQFTIFSRNATSVTLVIFHGDQPDSTYDEIELDPAINKTGDIWHIWVKGLKEGTLYGYKIGGPYDPSRGLRFNKNKLLIDPYSRAITGNFQWDLPKSRGYDPDSDEADLSFSQLDSTPYVPRSIVMKDWLFISEKQPGTPLQDLIIYELHVKGFTFHPSSEVNAKGTYMGLTEKIPYLKELGVTAVELMPIQEFDEFENINKNPLTGERLKNYWGYSTMTFFAPKSSYSSSGTMGEQVSEFRDMVKAFHDAGIEVILDVVFNHTAEGDQTGPTISFRGIDNPVYYILEEDKRFYQNMTGCGNTVNCNHPLMHDFILDCLRYWVIKMKVDGFRFDLASIFGRDQKGNILANPPLINKIEQDPILRNTKIIAEAWDAAGAYQLGEFPGRWAEWNGRYRDDVRRFWRGEPGMTGEFATRLTGSEDLYGSSKRGPFNSINFITCHDGFTMNDLVSYSKKHNTENGEDNRDGEKHNFSQNFGIEGEPATSFIDRIRLRQMKNLFATLMLSQGTPMILMGDEFRRTQRGNNNSYCQDNEISWVDWSLKEKNHDLFRFVKNMIAFRKDHPVLRRRSFFTGGIKGIYTDPDLSWHGPDGKEPDWSGKEKAVAVFLNGEYTLEEYDIEDNSLYVIFNPSMRNLYFRLPESLSSREWRVAIDTFNPSPSDFHNTDQPVLNGSKYYVRKLSVVVLIY